MDPRLGLALKYYDQGLPDAAWHTVHDLARADDAPREALHLAAVLCLEIGHHGEALAFADRLILSDTGDADAQVLRGQALRELGRFDDALGAFSHAATLRAPDAVLHFNLGLLHHRAGRLKESETSYRASLALRPDDAGAWNNLGLLYDDAGLPDAACEAFTTSISFAPTVSATYNNLGTVLAGQGRYAGAAAAHAKALEIDPRNIAARINLGVAQLERGAIDDARRAFDAALAQGPRNRHAADNRLYLDIYVETDPAKICTYHRAWGHDLHPAVPAAPRAPRKPLKIGYVSADFRRHSVSFFIAALFRHHDPREVEVHAYSDVTQPDDVTAQFRTLAPYWHDIAGWDDERLRTSIRDAGIDVLVDLSGHTNGNRLSVFAKRAAPVQVSALGYPATTGVAAMDYRLCDALTDPPGSETYATEQLMRLHALHCFTPPENAPEVSRSPATLRGYVTFGSFNKLAKISDHTIRLWAGVLKGVPGARLLLKTKPLVEEETRAALARRFAAHGIDAARLDLRGWQPGDAGHLGTYAEVDIALDTFPYNGTTTTCEALWMGVPVVSLAGRGHAARVGASVLTSAGLRSWCASSEDEFRDVAVRAAADNTLADLRAALRAQVRASRLCDGLTYTRDVESAYRAMCE